MYASGSGADAIPARDAGRWEVLECGKPWREADADIAEAIDFLEFYALEWLRLAPAKRLGHQPGELNHRLFTPGGHGGDRPLELSARHSNRDGLSGTCDR